LQVKQQAVGWGWYQDTGRIVVKILCAVLMLFGVLFAMTGCNTVKGLGQDVENVGDAMKDAAN
jgi:predicted small secreted protein